MTRQSEGQMKAGERERLARFLSLVADTMDKSATGILALAKATDAEHFRSAASLLRHPSGKLSARDKADLSLGRAIRGAMPRVFSVDEFEGTFSVSWFDEDWFWRAYGRGKTLEEAIKMAHNRFRAALDQGKGRSPR